MTAPLPRTIGNADRIVTTLLEWFVRHGRRFPWRAVETAAPEHDPYLILVSEIMLQQTQTSRVAVKLPEFIERFPTVEALASASTGDLLRAWQGMGYNRRALRLQETARAVVERHGGRFPASVEELLSLPGVGPYTASAVACFAFGQDVPVIDVNIRRVLSRLFYKCHTAELLLPERSVERVAEAIVPAGRSYPWHQALMDLGAVICTARSPRCGVCPLESLCLSAHPLPIRLFDPEATGKEEPMLRGIPRRIWRGRMVELLRGERSPVRLAEVIDRLMPEPERALPAERRDLVGIAAALHREGMIVRAGLREGEIGEGDAIMLPD